MTVKNHLIQRSSLDLKAFCEYGTHHHVFTSAVFGFDLLAQVTLRNTEVLAHITVVHHERQEALVNVNQLRRKKKKVTVRGGVITDFFFREEIKPFD